MALQSLGNKTNNVNKTIAIQTTANIIGYTVPLGKNFKGSIRGNAANCILYINDVNVNNNLPYGATDPQFFIELNQGDIVKTSAVGYIIGVESNIR